MIVEIAGHGGKVPQAFYLEGLRYMRHRRASVSATVQTHPSPSTQQKLQQGLQKKNNGDIVILGRSLGIAREKNFVTQRTS
jgi:hypothetical protein